MTYKLSDTTDIILLSIKTNEGAITKPIEHIFYSKDEFYGMIADYIASMDYNQYNMDEFDKRWLIHFNLKDESLHDTNSPLPKMDNATNMKFMTNAAIWLARNNKPLFDKYELFNTRCLFRYRHNEINYINDQIGILINRRSEHSRQLDGLEEWFKSHGNADPCPDDRPKK